MAVVVVGASVAGCATALHLARRGHAVTLVEREHFPREKVCGEGLMPHGVRELKGLGLYEAASQVGRPFPGIGYHVPGASAVARFPDHVGPGLGIRRLHLDELLLREVQQVAEVRLGTRVRRVTSGQVHTDDGVLPARVIVGADGAGSLVRRQLGLDRTPRGRRRYGARAHYRLSKPMPEGVEVHVADGGEIYITPVGDGVLNVALLLEKRATKRFRGDLSGAFHAFCAGHPPIADLLDGAEQISTPMLCGPLRQAAHARVADGAVLVGDAGGFVDAITGEGMSLGLLSGRLAADTLHRALQSNDTSVRALRPYDRVMRRQARDLTVLTELILWGIRRRRLARRVVRNLGRRPALFGRLLAINAGAAPLVSLGARGLLRLLR